MQGFVQWRHQRVVTRLKNLRQLNIMRAKKLGLQLSDEYPLTTISSSDIVTHSNGYIKGDKYLFFIEVGTANVLLKLN